MGSSAREMGFTRFIQNGRVCLVNYGDNAGKLAVVVDVIDQNRCLVYGPTSGVARQVIGYKRLSLTDIKIDIGRGAKAKTVDAVYAKENVDTQWANTAWGKKLAARKAKASANDFDRFKGMVSHKKKMVAIRKKLKYLTADVGSATRQCTGSMLVINQ